jgi:hypothetical protein
VQEILVMDTDTVMDTNAATAGTRATPSGSRGEPAQPSVTSLLRWSGAAALLGGLGILQAPLLHPEDTPEGLASPIWVANHFALYVGYLLVQVGLVGILVRQIREAGRLGVLGFAVAFAGAGLTLMEGRDHTFSLPILRLAGLQSDNPDALPGLWALILGAALFSLGHVLLGVAGWRARVFPRPAVALLAVGAPILAFSPPIPVAAVALVGSMLYGGGMIWIGATLLAVRGAERTGRPAPYPRVAMAAH